MSTKATIMYVYPLWFGRDATNPCGQCECQYLRARVYLRSLGQLERSLFASSRDPNDRAADSARSIEPETRRKKEFVNSRIATCIRNRIKLYNGITSTCLRLAAIRQDYRYAINHSVAFVTVDLALFQEGKRFTRNNCNK